MTTIGNSLARASLPQTPRLHTDDAPRPLFRVLAIAAGGLSAQRARMEVAAQNVANAETTRTAEGGPYRRKTVALQATADAAELGSGLGISTYGSNDVAGAAARSLISVIASGDPVDAGGVRVAGIVDDTSQGALVYDPGHPDADEKGYVRMPNVRITDEMMDMMDARRVYDANATVFQAAKAMLRRALDL